MGEMVSMSPMRRNPSRRTYAIRRLFMFLRKRGLHLIIVIIAALSSLRTIKYISWRTNPLYVAKGDYDYPSQSKSTDIATPLDAKGSKLRIMIFITTHMSAQHIWFLKACWPAALEHSSLLRSSDIAVYLNPPKEERKSAIELLQQTFQNQPLAIHVNDPADRQEGAMAALSNAARAGWFSGYDWIIRVNPDVIIRNDTWMLDTMRSEPDVTGLLINCRNSTTSYKIHTDFFAVKPEALPTDAFTTVVNDVAGLPNAENSFTHDLQDAILKKGNMRWIPGAKPANTACRAGSMRDPITTDVIHFHQARKMMKDLTCPIQF